MGQGGSAMGESLCGGPPELRLGAISHHTSPFPHQVSATLHHRAVSGASDRGSWFTGRLMLERRQKFVLLPLGEMKFGVPISFLPGVTLETA